MLQSSSAFIFSNKARILRVKYATSAKLIELGAAVSLIITPGIGHKTREVWRRKMHVNRLK